MRIDLCRACGAEMAEHHRCKLCRKPMTFFCYNCRNITDIQYHTRCYESVLLVLH